MSSQRNVKIYGGIAAIIFISIIIVYGVLANRDQSSETITQTATISTPSSNSEASNQPDLGSTQGTQTGNGSTNTSQSQSQLQSGGADNSQAQTFKDGSYSAEGTYASPASSSESIGVSLVLQDDTITSVTVTGNAKDRTSQSYQRLFINGISGEVVGKKIDDVDVSKINGSSLTSAGFNKALDKIKQQAQV